MKNNYIENVYWQLGGTSLASIASTMYNAERGSSGINSLTRYLAPIGLFYVSDYGYAVATANRSKCLTQSISNYNKQCTNNNWLYDSQNSSYNQWTITPKTGSINQAYRVTNAGKAAAAMCNSYGSIRPVIYLKANVVYDHDYTRTGSSSSAFKTKVIN